VTHARIDDALSGTIAAAGAEREAWAAENIRRTVEAGKYVEALVDEHGPETVRKMLRAAGVGVYEARRWVKVSRRETLAWAATATPDEMDGRELTMRMLVGAWDRDRRRDMRAGVEPESLPI
jgi:hypothetical protein